METLLASILALVVGVIIGNLLAKGKRQELETQAKVLQAQIENEKAQAAATSSAWQRQVEDVKASTSPRIVGCQAKGVRRCLGSTREKASRIPSRLASPLRRDNE